MKKKLDQLIDNESVKMIFVSPSLVGSPAKRRKCTGGKKESQLPSFTDQICKYQAPIKTLLESTEDTSGFRFSKKPVSETGARFMPFQSIQMIQKVVVTSHPERFGM